MTSELLNWQSKDNLRFFMNADCVIIAQIFVTCKLTAIWANVRHIFLISKRNMRNFLTRNGTALRGMFFMSRKFDPIAFARKIKVQGVHPVRVHQNEYVLI